MTSHRSDGKDGSQPPEPQTRVPSADGLAAGDEQHDGASAATACDASSPDVLVDQLASSLLGLGEMLLDETDVDDAIAHVLQVGVEAYGGSVAVSMSITDQHHCADGQVTRDATTDWARDLDRWQHDHDEGPCRLAGETMDPCIVEDVLTDQRFPRFGDVAAAMGVRRCVSYPMTVRGRSLGSLTVFSTSADRIDDAFVRRGEWLARTTAPLLANWLAHTRVARLADQLQEALAGRSVIERAKGVLMGELGISEDRAFEVLRTQSQHENTKLRDVARTLLANREAP